jgi:hypothetical protein
MNNVYPMASIFFGGFFGRAHQAAMSPAAPLTAQIRTVLAIIVKHGLPFDPVNRQ